MTAVGATSGRLPLSAIGELIEKALMNIEKIYPHAFVDEYVIMPNHIHFILVIDYDAESRRPMVAPTDNGSPITFPRCLGLFSSSKDM